MKALLLCTLFLYHWAMHIIDAEAIPALESSFRLPLFCIFSQITFQDPILSSVKYKCFCFLDLFKQ